MADGPASFNRDFTCPDLLRYGSQTTTQAPPTGLSPPAVARSNALRLPQVRYPKNLQAPPDPPYNPTGTTAAACHAPTVWAPPLSLAATRRITCCFLFLRVLRCFSSPGSPRTAYVFSHTMTGHHPGRVSPFGHPGINARLQLPPAFRSLPRPSSPSCAQASTPRPYCLIHSLAVSRSPHCALSALPTTTTPTPTCQKAAPRPASGRRTLYQEA